MTASLGRAELILDANYEQLIRSTAKAYDDTIQRANRVVQILAAQERVRIESVRAGYAIIADAEKKAAADKIKLEKEAADEQKKNTQELIRYNNSQADELKKNTQELIKYNLAQYKEDLAGWNATLKARDAANKASAAEQQAQTKALLAYNQQQYKEDLANWKSILKDRDAAVKQQAAEEAAIAKQRAIDQKNSPLNNLFGSNLGNTAATLLGFGAISSGAVVLRQAMLGINDAVLSQEQAVRALNGAYGTTAGSMKEFADAEAAAYSRVNADIEQNVAKFGVVQKELGATSEQTKKLTDLAINLQAAYGGDLDAAFQAVAGGIEGRARALLKYNIDITDQALKDSNVLTEEQKKHLGQLGEEEKAQARIKLILEQVNKVQGEAAARANEAAGAYDKWNRAVNELSKNLGASLVPELGKIAEAAANMLGWVNKHLELAAEARKAAAELRAQGIQTGIILNPDDPRIKAQIDFDRASTEGAKVAKANIDAITAAQEEAAKAEEQRIEAQNRQIVEQGDLIIQNEEENAKKRIEIINEEKKAAEGDKQLKLEALKEVHDQNLRDMEQEEYERERQSALELQAIEKEKTEALRANKDKNDGIIRGIRLEEQAEKDASDEAIRQAQIKRDAALKEIDDTHTARVREIEETHTLASRAIDDNQRETLRRLEVEKRAIDETRRTEDRDLADSVQKQERVLDDKHTKNVRRLDDEAKKEKDNSDQTIRDLEAQSKKEDDKHTKKIRDLDEAAKKAQDDFDAQIAAIDAVARARENATRTSQLQDKVQEAQKNLTQAVGIGTPEQVTDARGKLTQAIRSRDPAEVKKAEEELVAISGKGIEAIAKAEKELADAKTAFTNEGLTETENANKLRLQDEKKTAADEAASAKQQAEDDNKRRTDKLTADKQAEQDRLKDAIDKIDKRKRKEDDANTASKRGIQDSTEYAKRQLQDRRTAEDIVAKDAIEQAAEVARRAKQANDDITKNAKQNADDVDKNSKNNVHETYDGEDHGLIPAIKRAQAAHKELTDAAIEEATNAATAQQRDITDTYDAQIQAHNNAENEAKHHYSVQVAIANARYDAERIRVEHLYRDPDGKSGILDRLDALAKATTDALALDKTAWENWKKDLTDPKTGTITSTFEEAQKAAQAFFDMLQKRGGVTIDVHIGARPSSGPSAPGGGDTPGSSGGGGGSNNQAGESNPYGNRPTGQFESFGGGDPVELGSVGNSVAPGATLTNIQPRFVDDYIDKVFNKKISSVAAAHAKYVYHHEGASDYVGDFGTSFGPFQLHVGGGLGDSFISDTGLDIRNPFTWQAQVDWVADYVKANGWGENWHGAPELYNVSYARGNLFYNPTLTYDTKTGSRGILAETGPERLLGRDATVKYDSSLHSMLNGSMGSRMDEMSIGGALARVATVLQQNSNNGGDSFTYNGVAPDDVMQQWRDDQRRQRVLRGVVHG